MGNFSENGIQFTVGNAGIYTGGMKIARLAYQKDSNGNIQGAQKVINAIDIDWNNAIIPGLNDNNPISNTSEVLKLISNLSSTNTQIDFETLREEINALVNSKHQVMTYAEYIALEEKDPNVIYFILDDNGNINPVTPDEPTEYTIDNIEQLETSLYINNVEHTESNITLVAGSKYLIEGTLLGNIVIDATNADTETLENTEVVLNGVTIINPNGNYGIKYNTPDGAKGYKDLVVTIAPNSINYILCTKEVAVADDQPGAIYSTNNLCIQGSGYLACYNLGGHAIRGSELKLISPHIYAHASHDAIHAKRMWICGGYYYINTANDAFGTGIGGTIWYAYGHIYLNTLNGLSFNAKSGTVNNEEKIGNIYYIEDFDITSATIYQKSANVTSIQNLYSGTFVKEYDNATVAKAASVSGTDVVLTNGMYTVTKNFVTISGKLTNPIYIPSSLTDVTIYLNNVLLTTQEVDNLNSPSIYYESTASNVKLFSLNGTYNAIINNCESINTGGDSDAVKSEHNIKVELKNDSYIYVTANCGDGLDGTDVNITDSKGVLMIHKCGERGIKGTNIIIGPSANTPQGVMTLITDKTSQDYTTFDGAIIATENCQEFSAAIPSIAASNIASGTGYADLFARKGKSPNKGSLYVTDDELKGVVICNSIGAMIELSLDNSSNFYYNNDFSSSNVVQTNIPEANIENYVAIGYKNIHIS